MRPTLGAVAGLALAACDPPPGGRAAGRAPEPPWAVEVAGCAAVRREDARGRVCEVGASRRTLRMWIETDGAPPRVSWSGHTLTAKVDRAVAGIRVTVDLPPEAAREAGTIEVAADPARGRSARLLATDVAAADARLDRANELRRRGAPAEARAALGDVGALPEEVRARGASLLARIDLAEGRTEEAIAGLARSMEVHRRRGRASDEAADGMALAHALVSYGRRYAEAGAALDAIAAALEVWDEGRAHVGFYRALVQRDTGDVRGALRDLADTEARARRLDLAEAARNAGQVRARLLLALGRGPEAVALLDEILAALPDDAPACTRADLLTNRGWAELWEGLSGGGARPRPELGAILTRALTLYQGGCPRPADVQNAEANLALLELLAGDLEAAARHLAAARGSAPSAKAETAAWLLELGGRLALAREQPREALRSYDELTVRAEAGYFPEAAWQAATGRGRAWAALGDTERAVAALREAEAILDRRSLLVPLRTGRASYLGDRDESARALVEILVQAGRPAEALAAARVARARAIAGAQRADRVAGLDARARARWNEATARYQREREDIDRDADGDWKVAADRLPALRERRGAARARAEAALDDMLAALAERPVSFTPAAPAPGEVILAFFPSGGGRYRAFAADAQGIVTASVADPSGASAETVAAELAPFAEAIDRAHRLRVLAYGAFVAVDVHALPFHGAPLVAALPVVYALDFPAPPRPASESRRALVVADPRRDLLGAGTEYEGVAGRLAGAFSVRRLGGGEATRAAVLEQLAEADLFHFAGHGVFAGPTGWDSGLLLAAGGTLDVGDVLSLPRAPAGVVLSGCETARVRADVRGVDPSLANAFVAAGSDEVVATVRPVTDRLAASLAAALYDDAALADRSLVEALRRAQVGSLAVASEEDWAAYRVFVP